KFTKYLIYALGEIVLVVIGILIALQINNWNQERQHNKQEKTYLEDLKSDLLFDIETLEQKIVQNETAVENISEVMTLISSKKAFSDEDKVRLYQLITPLCGETYFIPEKGTIRQIEASSAGSFIQNKTLKDQVFRYYSSRQREEKNMEQSIQLYQHNFVTPHILLSVGLDPAFSEGAFNETYELESTDFSSLLKNKQFITALFMKKVGSTNQTAFYQIAQKEAEQIIVLIDDELKK
ncbi:MAG: DUF6090 family protein, partial [Flavobacteriales bacterium]